MSVVYKGYEFVFHPTRIDINNEFVIKPKKSGCIMIDCSMTEIPSYIEINRWREYPFTQLPEIITYAAEHSLMEISTCADRLMISLALDSYSPDLDQTIRLYAEPCSG